MFVLYSGLPCQIAGLNYYLKEKKVPSGKLLTIDMFCYHAPDNEYLCQHMELLFGIDNIEDINFRVKQSDGWRPKGYEVVLKNQEKKYITGEDEFLQGFQKAIVSRRLCNQCKFADFPRQGDISLGDFWRIGQIEPSWDDNSGTSVILSNSTKGKRFLNSQIQYFDRIEEVPLEWLFKTGNRVGKSKREDTIEQRIFRRMIRNYSFEEEIHFSVLNPKEVKGNMNNRVMIINFCHRDFPVNYGQTLLAFALSKKVRDMGFLPITASYTRRSQEIRRWYEERYFFPDLKTKYSKAFYNTTRFVKEHMNVIQCYNEMDVYRLSELCDIFLCGGDVIWRTGHYDPVFYLNFGNPDKLRISYSASIGAYNEEEYETYERIFTMITNHIDYISTRENLTVELFKKL